MSAPRRLTRLGAAAQCAAAAFVVASALGAAPSSAQSLDVPALAPGDAALTLYVDFRQIQVSRSFLRVMDIVEQSEGYRAAAEKMAAWGFEPRTDLRELLLVVRSLEGEPEFVAVATGDVDTDALVAQLETRSRLTRGDDALGRLWVDGRLGYDVREDAAIAGTAPFLSGVRQAYTDAEPVAVPSHPESVWLQVRPSEADRAATPSLRNVMSITVTLVVDDAPTLALNAELTTADAATEAATELNRALRTVATVPEVTAFGLGPLLASTTAVAEGTTLRMVADLDAASWARFTEVLEDLVEEELR